ncbi:hypothetical protein BJX99DRAFT_254508 [Aspergillus californicus]
MPSGIAQRAREVIRERLPDLAVGPKTTTSSSLKDIHFVGTLEPWQSFETEALKTYQATLWKTLNTTIKYCSQGNPAAIDGEYFLCGSEGGVQARMQANLSQVMSAICATSGVDLAFGDYHATTDRATGGSIPDIAIMTNAGEVRRAIRVDDGFKSLRHILPKDAKLKYGFITTYEETIFIKQECRNGQWVILYSRPIRSNTKFNDEGALYGPRNHLAPGFLAHAPLLERRSPDG